MVLQSFALDIVIAPVIRGILGDCYPIVERITGVTHTDRRIRRLRNQHDAAENAFNEWAFREKSRR